MASFSSTYPAQRPVFTLDAANAGRLDPRMTFTRSDTPPTYAAPSAVHYWSNEKHLSSENLITYSSDISQSAWTKNGVTETGGQAAPDGGTDAYKLSEDSANSLHRIYYVATVDSSASLTFSCYVKYIGRQWVYLRLRDNGGTYRYVYFDVQNGTKGTEEANITGTIAASGNGYYKLTANVSSAYSTSEDIVIGGAAADGNNAAYTGLNGDAFAIWGLGMSTTGETVLNETSGQIHREYAPTLKSVATAGQPRFEYDPSTDGQSVAKGILIESQAQNLIQQSDSIDNAYWTKQNSTVTAAAAVGVTGELNACLITEIEDVSPATSVHSVYSSAFGLSSATSCTFSLYCKAAGVNRVQLLSTVGGSVRNAIINIANGTVISESSATGAVESVGNGFYRISITYTAPATTNGRVYLNLLNDSGTSDYAGNGYNGVIATGFQFEQNSFPSSLISTSGSAATRASESLSITDASIFTSGEHSVYWEGSVNGSTADPRLFELHNNSSTDRVMVDNNDGTKLRLNVKVGNTDFVLSETTTAIPDNSKVVATVKANEARLVLNGTTTVTDTSTPISSGYLALSIGSNYSGAAPLDGHVRRVSYWSTALTETQAQALTS